MKILFSLLAFCLFASCVHSQEAVDTVSVRVQYRVKYNERNMKLRDKDAKKYLLTVLWLHLLPILFLQWSCTWDILWALCLRFVFPCLT